MIGSFGIGSSGLVPKRLSDIISQVNTSLKADIGANFNLLSQTPEGQLVNRLSEQVADLWEAYEQGYNNVVSPFTASGVGLDNTLSLMNVFRIPATASVVNGVVLSGTPGATVPASLQLYPTGNSAAIFQISEATVLDGAGSATVSFVALLTGPTPVAIGALTNFVASVSGITGATNPAAAEVGTLVETDSAFRTRALQETARTGTGTFDGLLRSVRNVANVSKVYLFVNDLSYVDSNGLAPHSVQLVVVGGIDQEIFNAIAAAKGAGIETNGDVVGAVIDSQGVSHQVKFSRLTNVPIYIDVTITRNNNPALGPVYPGNGDALVSSAIMSYGATYAPGQTVVDAGIEAAAFIPGVLTVTVLISIAPSPTLGTNIPIPIASIATFSPSNLVIHS